MPQPGSELYIALGPSVEYHLRSVCALRNVRASTSSSSCSIILRRPERIRSAILFSNRTWDPSEGPALRDITIVHVDYAAETTLSEFRHRMSKVMRSNRPNNSAGTALPLSSRISALFHLYSRMSARRLASSEFVVLLTLRRLFTAQMHRLEIL
jgi:hypothetical protein